MSGVNLQDIKRKARCGNRPWVFWHDRTGTPRAERADARAIKGAMLATGTAKRWIWVSAGSGRTHQIGWRQAIVMLRNARAGCL